MKTLRLILGDQLNAEHSWFDQVDKSVDYLMMEVRQETDYVMHHIQKVVAFFCSMRAFANVLRAKGHNVIYLKLDSENNKQDLTKNIQTLIDQYLYQRIEVMYADEYRVQTQLQEYLSTLSIEHQFFESEHFLIPSLDIEIHFKKNKSHVMESFYRKLRKRFNVLMDGDKPVTGKWNYDKENRKKLPKNHRPIQPKSFSKNVSDIVDLIDSQNIKTFGELDPEHFIWPTNRTEAKLLFDFFLEECLPYFGTYQDAMSNEYWSIYHSRISFVLNVKLLSPIEVIRKVEEYWHNNQERVALSQVEGFIRQILGWREFMRGMYWINMPNYSDMNFFDHDRELPSFFWTGQTDLNCLNKSINQSLEYAYAHHIQRLMITGNYMLLTETHPDAADGWYLGIYIDALEWVEMPNTRGMSQFADGGLIATKPYISSGNYINKMSNYCSNCKFDPKQRLGDKACPFNSLYWRFLYKNQDKLRKNMRMRYSFITLDKFTADEQLAINKQAEKYLVN